MFQRVAHLPAFLGQFAGFTAGQVFGGEAGQACPVLVGSGLAVGQQADFAVLDGEHFALAGLAAPEQLDAHVFASSRSNAVAQVWVAGQRRVAEGRHALHQSAQQGFVAARAELLQEN